MYSFNRDFPDRSEVLLPHRKDYYLLVLIRQGGGRQWIDMTPYSLKDNAIYFMGPDQVIVKEQMVQLTSIGIAFTKDFLTFQETSIATLPIIKNPGTFPELVLEETNMILVEDIISKIMLEYQQPSQWQNRMLGAYLTVLLTHLSRLYDEQASDSGIAADKTLLKSFLAKVNERFAELHEVSHYASLLHISAGHLSESVKKQSGKPAIKHIHDRLVMESRRLLMHTNSPIKEIAYNLGFTDASYFNRFFKRETGLTPVEYRVDIRRMSH